MLPDQEFPRRARLLGAAGAALAAMAVALSAYAAHVVQAHAQAALYTAAALSFGHGVALAALSSQASSRLRFVGLCGLLLGTVLFSGSLVLHHAFGLPVRLAPFGGSVMILSWLLFAVAALRR
jgi:uncharacterized membrane protein YgdD (TMEM256/DUF423 family)